MTVSNYVANIVRAIFAPFADTDDNGIPDGADAVYRAINEMGDMTTGVFEAKLGEPTVEQTGGLFTSVPKVVIPIEDTKYGDAGSLVFDIPEGIEDTSAHFWNLLEAFGYEPNDLDQLTGETVPVRYSGGNVIVMWDQLLDRDEHEDAADD